MEEKKNIKVSIYYVVILVAVLLISAVTVSYAYINAVSSTANSANTTVSGKTECVNISLADLDATYSLTYNYPITDDFALTNSNVKPIRVKITNNCTAAQNASAIDYTIVLTTLADVQNSNNYIPASKIKTKVDKQINTNAKTVLIATNLLNKINTLPGTSTTKSLLDNKITEKKLTEKYYEHYVLEKGTIANQTSITYETYLWIDYTEGGQNESTQGKTFKTIISVIVNNPESGVTGGLKTT